MSLFATNLAYYRRLRGLSQVELANKTKLKPSAINHFERDRRKPNLVNLKRLCYALNVSADALLGLPIFPK